MAAGPAIEMSLLSVPSKRKLFALVRCPLIANCAAGPALVKLLGLPLVVTPLANVTPGSVLASDHGSLLASGSITISRLSEVSAAHRIALLQNLADTSAHLDDRLLLAQFQGRIHVRGPICNDRNLAFDVSLEAAGSDGHIIGTQIHRIETVKARLIGDRRTCLIGLAMVKFGSRTANRSSLRVSHCAGNRAPTGLRQQRSVCRQQREQQRNVKETGLRAVSCSWFSPHIVWNGWLL